MRVAIHRQSDTDSTLGKVARDIGDLTTLTARQADTIALLSKCVFGTIALVLLAVGGAVLSLVVAPREHVAASSMNRPAASAAGASTPLRVK